MTYEEKLDKIINKFKDERSLSRKGHKSVIIFNEDSFTKIGIREICQIMLQLQDDEHILDILDVIQPIETLSTEQIINPSDLDDYDGAVEIKIEIGEELLTMSMTNFISPSVNN